MDWVRAVSADSSNKIRLKMREVGLPLEGMRWRITGYSRHYSGFEFHCDQYERLLTMAEQNSRFRRHNVTLPGADDPWRDARIDAFGYSQIGVYNYLHLDIATNKPGLCRVYIAPHSWGRMGEDHRGPPKYLSNEVFVAIDKRLSRLGIKLQDYIDMNLMIGGTTLDGVSFSPRNYDRLKLAVQNARRASGTTFIEGKKTQNPDVIDLSFLATSGTGHREINWTNGQSANLDFSALHLALSPVKCNVHIDEFGVVVSGPDGQMSLSPNALHHIANELVLKSIVKDFLYDKVKLPKGIIDHLFVELPNTSNNFNGAGIGIEVRPWKSVRITAGHSCTLNDGDCRKTFTFSKSW
jgi:hypothetical protein